MYSGGVHKVPRGFGSRGLVRHFCTVPLICLTAIGSGFRPAIARFAQKRNFILHAQKFDQAHASAVGSRGDLSPPPPWVVR